MVASLLEALLSEVEGLAKRDWLVPDYTTLCRRQKTLMVSLASRASAGGLHLLIDSTGIKMMGRRMEDAQARCFLSPSVAQACSEPVEGVHLWIDAETLAIRAIEVTTNAIGEAATLPDFLAQVPSNERIATVGGDGAYDTRKCRVAIAARGANAVIPVRRNGQPWKSNALGVDVRNETLRTIKRLGQTIWKRWSGYHRRSLIETKMHCFKLLGERVASRTFDRQITKLKVRAAVLNRFSQIETPNTIRVA